MVINPVSIGERPVPVAQESSGGCGCGGCGGGGGNGAVDVEEGASVEQASATTATYSVEGMTCGHCVGAVTQELSAVPGVTDVEISLVKDGVSTVTVRSAAPLDVEAVRAAVDEAGYALVENT